MLYRLRYGLSAAPQKPENLADILSSACFDLSATQSGSTDLSGQTWSNLVKTPADGAAQADYNFYRGAGSGVSTDDPTPGGNAGNTDGNWSFDGGDYFKLVNAANPPLFKNWHKTSGGAQFWIAMAGKTPSSLGTQINLISTRNGASSHALALLMNSSNHPTATQSNGTISVSATFSGITFSAGTDYLLIMSGDFSQTTSNIKCWLNNRTGTVSSVTGLTDTTDNTLTAAIGAIPSGASGQLTNGWLVYGVAGGNALIGDAEAAKLFDFFNKRHAKLFA